MITKTEAHTLVSRFLSKIEYDAEMPLVLLEGETIERSFGWVFFYDSKKHFETQDPKYLVAGNAPLIVDRNTGEIHETGTARSIEFYLEEYEKRLQ